MNIILVLVDSLNKEALKTYNPDTICESPNLEAFANKSLVFDNHFIGSLPCMPARREISAGRKEFMWRPWGPLEAFDPKLPKEVQKAGYTTAIVTDHYHYWEEMANGYIEWFNTAEFIRGHECDNYRLPQKGPVPAWVDKMSEFRSEGHMRQYYANVSHRHSEEDFFPALTFTAAAQWLDDNAANGPFFLQVESFDVHEPFHVPEPYASMYTDGIEGNADDYNIWPPYQVYDDLDAFMAQTSAAELAYLKSQYYGKTTMVDKWFGTFMDKLDALNLWQDTMVIFTTDHGHDLGQRNIFGKQYPHYDSHANIPLMIWDPRNEGQATRTSAWTQTVDLFATVIEASGGTPPESTRHSKSVLPILTDSTSAIRPAITYGTFGQGVCVSNDNWTLFKSPVSGKPLYTYSTAIYQPLIVDNPIDGRVGAMPNQPVDNDLFDPSVPYPMWKTPVTIDPRSYENYLFSRKDDPEQKNNLWDSNVRARDEMLVLLKQLLSEEGYPAEQMERLGLDLISVG